MRVAPRRTSQEEQEHGATDRVEISLKSHAGEAEQGVEVVVFMMASFPRTHWLDTPRQGEGPSTASPDERRPTPVQSLNDPLRELWSQQRPQGGQGRHFDSL